MDIKSTKGIESKIKEITVYRGGAFITRTAEVSLKKGRNTITLDGLSSTIKKDSIQIGVSENVSCLQVSFISDYNKNKLDTKGDLKELEVSKKISEVRKQVEVIDMNLKMMKSVNVRFDVSDGLVAIKNYSEYNMSKINELLTKKSDLEKEIALLTRKETAEKSFTSAGKWKLLPGIIKLELLSEEDQDSEIEIQYFDVNADWKPNYDIRLDDTKSTVTFALKANITQNTGESWINTDISISTGTYSLRRFKGELKTWNITASDTRNSGKGFLDRAVDYEDSYGDDEISYSRIEAIGREEDDLPVAGFLRSPATRFLEALETSDSKKGISYDSEECNTTSAIDNQNSIVYKLSEKCTVLNAKGSGTVTVTKHEIPCELDIHTTPKLDCTAFIVANVKDYAKYGFLKCRANVFFNNRFVGQTAIEASGEDGIMKVSLGPDNKIIIRRIVEKELNSKAFIGGSQTKEVLYSIKIDNKKPIPAHIIVTDQLPVSLDSKVTVETTHLSKGTVDNTNGKVTWDINLAPDESVDLKFGFKIITKR